MRWPLEFHIHTYSDPALRNAVRKLERLIKTMNEALTNAVTALTAEVAENQDKLESAVTFIKGTPDLVAAAVRQALADNDVSEEAAAASIEAARASMSDGVDALVSAVSENTPAE